MANASQLYFPDIAKCAMGKHSMRVTRYGEGHICEIQWASDAPKDVTSGSTDLFERARDFGVYRDI